MQTQTLLSFSLYPARHPLDSPFSRRTLCANLFSPLFRLQRYYELLYHVPLSATKNERLSAMYVMLCSLGLDALAYAHVPVYARHCSLARPVTCQIHNQRESICPCGSASVSDQTGSSICDAVTRERCARCACDIFAGGRCWLSFYACCLFRSSPRSSRAPSFVLIRSTALASPPTPPAHLSNTHSNTAQH